MKKIIFYFLLLFPPAIIVLMNEFHPPVSTKYSVERCTRFCHSKRCLHFEKKLKGSDSVFYKKVNFLVEKNIELLKNNPFGLDYKSCNLLIYVVIFPLLILLFLLNLFRKNSAHEKLN